MPDAQGNPTPEEIQAMQVQQLQQSEQATYMRLRELNAVELNNIAVPILAGEGTTYLSPRDEKRKVNGEEYLKEVGEMVIEDFKFDLGSRSEWERKTRRALKLFGNLMPDKTTPWKNASNINLPFISIACIQFHARSVDALLPPKGVVNVLPTGDEDTERAERVRKYMNYDLLYNMDGFEDGFDKSMIQLPLVGSVFRKTYYNPVAGKNVSTYVSAIDIVVDYNARSEGDVRLSHIIRMRKDDIRKRAATGIFAKKAWDYESGSITSIINDGELEKTIRELEGSDAGAYHDGDNPRYLIEQHRWLDINGDGLQEPYVVTVDYEEEEVIRITPRRVTDASGETHVVNHFTHYQFIPNPEGYYAIGYGLLLLSLNEGANTIVNEVIDAGALANMPGGFVSRRAGLKGGNLNFKLGEFKEVDSYTDDISKAIMHLNFKGPDQTLYATLGLLYEYAKLVSSVSEISTGQLPASDTPAHTVLALIEEGKKVYNAIHRRMHRAFKKELHKLFRLNSVYLDEEKYFKVLGDTGTPVGPGETVGVKDFVDSLDVFPVSDPNIASTGEKVTKAREVYDVVLANPLSSQNPGSIYEATYRYLDSLGVERIEKVYPPPPPPPDLSPEEENANFLKEQPANVIPTQDHARHLRVLEELENGPYADQLTPDGRKMAEQHKQEHIAAMYLQEKQLEGGPSQ